MSEIIEDVTNEEVTEVDTHEYVIIGDENYKTESVSTGTDSISFALVDIAIADAVEKFSGVTELKVSVADLEPYGIYENLTFKSATVDADGLVTVSFHIASAEEKRIAMLEQTQAEQDEVIAELIGGELNE